MHARFLLPSLFAVLLPVAVVAGARGRTRPGLAVIVVSWAVVCAVWLRVPYAGEIGTAPGHRGALRGGPLSPEPGRGLGTPPRFPPTPPKRLGRSVGTQGRADTPGAG